MTVIDLLKDMAAFTETATKDIILDSSERGTDGSYIKRPPKVFLMNIPDKEAEKKVAPCIILQAITGKDIEGEGRKEAQVTENMRIVVQTFNRDAQIGALDVLEILERLRIELRQKGVLSAQYGIGEIETLVYPNTMSPYYMGEMMIEFGMPAVKRELPPEYALNGEEF